MVTTTLMGVYESLWEHAGSAHVPTLKMVYQGRLPGGGDYYTRSLRRSRNEQCRELMVKRKKGFSGTEAAPGKRPRNRTAHGS